MKFTTFLHSAFILLFLLKFPIMSRCSPQGELVAQWAEKIGKELWHLGQVITKSLEIKSRYAFLNAQIEKKDPEKLLAEIVENISRMMDRKMDAIRCILKKAEDEAEMFEYNGTSSNFTYYSSKYSQVDGMEPAKIYASLENNTDMYLNMTLNNDTHFYNLPVNTSHSSVHVPTNIYDKYRDVQIAIQWSETLDEVFVKNYKSDPALSWQYFGSSTGIMRHYPAMRWVIDNDNDIFDCRIRTWFIEAATCTKDIVILLDTTGSMHGMGKHIAYMTVSSILDTFSNNDYINILTYNIETNFIVPCFKDMLVQATQENIQVFKNALEEVDSNEKAKLPDALETAFNLLHKYRIMRNCNENSSDCNQAIMLVTDYVDSDFKEVFEKHNSNATNISVRIFTYLIGAEVGNVNEIMWMACANRGYYTHVQSLEQVTGSVLKYIPVIARPLVLQGVEHPVSWTHAYADITYNDETDDQINEPHRLLTSVAVPAFDRKANKNNETRMADLLGVAATDVPIDDIKKLTFPYKIGVNAYPFVVSNNGYVLMHPDLRPVENKRLKENYNSIDLTEVELLDDDLGPRELSETIKNLRLALVNGVKGSMSNVSVKYHYDNMRRVSREVFDYYFAPLNYTPFSIGLAVPNSYGYYSLKVVGEIQRNRHSGIKITSFFKGSNWKIHPKWTYCKYHYLEGHEFSSPEQELLHFLDKMYDSDFKWERQYEAAKTKKHEYFGFEEEVLEGIQCGRKTLGDNDYYCDEQLVQRLLFDAKNTMPAFAQPWTFKNDAEKELFHRYNATLRFVATMSGLTRWEYIFGEENKTQEFGDIHAKAIDEIWYKSAVLQHQHDVNSFVYSVPFEGGDEEELLITGSYAIFPKDAVNEAPGSVVGFQFSHSHMRKRMLEISSKVSTFCPKCAICGRELDCYIVDSSGYIIVSDSNNNDTGRFFGEVEGAVLESMLNERIFHKITVYDYQAVCIDATNESSSSGNAVLNPFSYIKIFLQWCISNIVWMLFETVILVKTQGQSDSNKTAIPIQLEEEKIDDDEEEEEPRMYPCEKQRDLYILDQSLLRGYSGEVRYEKPFFVKRIPYSNLIFIAVNNTLRFDSVKLYASPRDIVYENDTEHPCQKLNLMNLTRRHLSGCFNEHPLEYEIKACGRGTKTTNDVFLNILLTMLINIAVRVY